MKSLFYYHILHLLRSPATALFLGAGWAAAILITFIYGAFIATNRAELTGLFTILPWVMAVLIPALVMPVAEEKRRGITERLRTLPHTPGQRLIARYCTYAGLLKLWVIGFWPMALTVAYLGNPDWGRILAGYIGSVMVGSVLLAVTLVVCLCARGGVRGFVISLAVNLALLVVGLPSVLAWLAYALPSVLLQPLQTQATLLAAFQPFLLGVVNLGAFCFLLALGAFILLMYLTWRHPRRAFRAWPLTLLLTAIAGFALAFIPATARWQLDLTATHANSLAPATRAYLANLHYATTLTLFQSRQNPDIPPAVLAYTRSFAQTLAAMQAAGGGKLAVKTVDADTQPTLALKAGLTQQQLPTGTAYFLGLQASSAVATRTIPALDAASPGQQEASALRLLADVQQAGDGVITLISANPVDAQAPWYQALTARLPVQQQSPAAGQLNPQTKLVVLFANPMLAAETRDALLSYLNGGGNLLLVADPLSRAFPPAEAPDEGTPFTATLAQWGVQFNPQAVVADTAHATPVRQTETGTTTYPFWVRLGPSARNGRLPFTQVAGTVTWAEGGQFTLATVPSAVSAQPVLTSAPSAQVISATLFSQVPAENLAASLTGPEHKRILAILLKGQFTGPSSQPAQVLAFADADWLAPQFAPQGSPNLALFAGGVDALLGNPILAARNRQPRTLTRVEDLYARLNHETEALQQRIAADLFTTAQNLDAFQASNPNAAQLTEAQQQQLANFRNKEFTLQQQLRQIRQHTRTRVYWLENALLLLNLFAMPTLLALGAYFARRRMV